MLEVKDLSISILGKQLVKHLSFILNKNDKLAVIGEEGNGKSTLLKAILGICSYAKVEGKINMKENRIGYLEQSISKENLPKKVLEFLFLNNVDYYNKRNRFYRYLDWMHLNDEILERTIDNLSGGEKVKIGILKLLLEEYDILFLDEPTNDLDIETLKWLEQFINHTTKPILYVSHDETLLARTANMILHLEQIKHKTDCRNTLLKIDYDTYITKRYGAIERQRQIAGQERRKFQQKQEKLRQITQKVEYQQNTISRSDPHGARLLKKKMHSLKAQEKKLNNVELVDLPDVEEEIHFFFESITIPRTKKIIDLNIPQLVINSKCLSRNIVLSVIGNKHICIIGKNGVGKSTLLKQIWSQLNHRNDIKVGYMPQNYADVLNDEDRVLDFICPNKKKEDITKARMYLGNMKFTKEEMVGKINQLSNGTKAKLLLIKLVLDKCNVLLLDEPTRNVSPLSNPVIRRVLKEYQGTIISASHDRRYIAEVIDDLYLLTPNGLIKKDKDV